MPPTDPRILNMTPEQIDLEFEHIKIDKYLKDQAEGKNVYEDDEYEAYDAETDEEDNTPINTDFSTGSPAQTNSIKEEEWEDVEIGDI